MEIPPWEGNYVGTGYRIESHRVGATYLWDIVLPITTVEWEDVRPRWEDHAIGIERYGPGTGSDVLPLEPRPLVAPTEPRFYYIEVSGAVDGPDPGDTMVIGALNRSHQGASLHFRADTFNMLWHERVPGWNETYTITLEEPRFVNPIHSAVPPTWDVVVGVESVEPGWEEVRWDALRYDRDAPGAEDGPLAPFPGEGSLDRTSTGHWYVEDGVADGIVSPGDRIFITSADHDFGGHRGGLETGSVNVARVQLPGHLPYTGGSCELSEPELSRYTLESGVYTEAAYTVTEVNATEGPIPLTNVFIGVDLVREEEFSVFNRPRHHLVGTLKAWGQDTDGSATITEGDVFYVTGLTHYHVGRAMTIERWEQAIARTRLPSIVYGADSTIRFHPPALATENTTDGLRLEAAYGVSALTPKDVEVLWDRVTAKVFDAAGETVLVPTFSVTDGTRPDGDALSAWLEKGDDESAYVASGDTVWVLGIGRRLLGGVMDLELGDMGLCRIHLPAHAEGVDVEDLKWNMARPVLEYQEQDGEPRWKVLFGFYNTTEGVERVDWGQVTVELVSWDGTFTVGPQALQPFPPDGTEGWDGFNTRSVTSWGIDAGSDTTHMGRGDGIGLTGITEVHAGAKVSLLVGPHRSMAYQYVLPGTLPGA